MISMMLREYLERNYRCFYFNSPPMVAGLRSYVAAAGVDVERAIANKSLILTSAQVHLQGTRFHIDSMIQSLEETLLQALADGYDGLWATGDLTWEMGPEKNFAGLLEYEWRLEELFQAHPQLSGVCQYHADSLPPQALRQGLVAHQTLFVNRTLASINPHYVHRDVFQSRVLEDPRLESAIQALRRDWDGDFPH